MTGSILEVKPLANETQPDQGVYTMTKTELKTLEDRIAALELENRSLKQALKDSVGLDDAGFLRVTQEVGDKAATVAGDVAGELVKLTGNTELAKQVDAAVTQVAGHIARMATRYLAVPIRQLVLGENIWDGKNNWFLFDLPSDTRDDDLTILDHPIGHYPHNAPNAPSTNDGSYGRRSDGDLATEGYNLHWRPEGAGAAMWTTTVPEHCIVTNPHDPELKPGIYAMRYDNGAGDNGPDPKYSTGRFNQRNPRGAWMILQKTAKGELRTAQCFYGPRAWVHRNEA